MDVGEVSIQVPECPEASDKLETQIRQAVDELIGFIRSDSGSLRLMDFERSLWSQMAVLFRLCVAMFLALRHERLNLSDYEVDGLLDGSEVVGNVKNEIRCHIPQIPLLR